MNNESNDKGEKHLVDVIHRLIGLIVFLLLVILGLAYVALFGVPKLSIEAPPATTSSSTVSLPAVAGPASRQAGVSVSQYWRAPDTTGIPSDALEKQIRYGRMLIANTAAYFGPNGTLAHQSNGMNCQNCHLDAGTKPYGNNYSAVASTYPKFRERSGRTESIYKRVNDCFVRSRVKQHRSYS